jgi:hypothetical protein
MPSLKEVLTAPGRRKEVIADCVTVIDQEVASKGGLTGLAVKAAYATVKAVKPGIIPHAVDDLLDEFAEKLEPFHGQAQGASQPIDEYLGGRASEVAEALLSVTDARAKKSKHATIRKAYEKLRPSGKKHVTDAMPRVGRLLKKYAA